MNRGFTVAVLSAALIAGTVANADAATATRTVQFARGAEAATVSGSIRGYNLIQYRITARAGQRMTVRMNSRYPVYFNVYAPNQRPGVDNALHNGSMSGDEFTTTLARGGTYTVLVYQMRASARRNANYPFSLRIEIPRLRR